MKKSIRKMAWILAVAMILTCLLSACGKAESAPKTDAAPASEPAKTEPAKTEPAKTEPAKTESSGKTYKFIFTCWTNDGNDTAQFFKDFFAKVEEATEGRVIIEQHFNGTLFSQPEALNAVITGAADICAVIPANEKSRLPLYGVTTWGSRISDINCTLEAVNKFGTSDLIQNELAENNLRFIIATGADGQRFIGSVPIHKVDDLKGLTIHADGLGAEVLSRLGAAPAAIPSAELYEAHERGTVDLSWCPMQAALTWGFSEIAKYYMPNSDNGCSNFPVFMNLEKWNSLEPELQEIIMQTAAEFYPGAGDRYVWGGVLKGFEEKLEANGTQIVEMDEEDAEKLHLVREEVIAEEIAKLEAQGVPAGEAYDLFQQYLNEAAAEMGLS